MDSLATILTSPPELDVLPSRAAWWARHRAIAEAGHRPIDQAILGGFSSDRLAYAYASGLQAALHVLLPDLPVDRIVSLCVTEGGGAHPRDIETRLDPTSRGGFRLSGRKRWTALSSDASELLVAASEGEGASGRKVVRLVRVDARAPGVSRRPMPEAPFIPEIGHDEVEFEGVLVEPAQVLEGDGYQRYVKAFRVLEDLHLHAATLAYLLREVRVHELPRPLAERLFALLTALRALADDDLASPASHVALAGLMDLGRAVIAEIERPWARTESPSHARWERDRLLLDVARSGRERRIEKAWLQLG